MTLSLDDVRNKRFRMARKSGYEVLEVDEFVDEVEESFAQLIEENQSLKKQVDALKAASPAAPEAEAQDSSPAPAAQSAPQAPQVEQAPQAQPAAGAAKSAVPGAIVVTTAKEASSAVVRLVEMATEQSERLVAEATDDANRIREEANRTAHQVTTDARTRAERVESESRVNAERVQADALSRAEKLDREIEGRRAEMFGDLERQRDELTATVASLRTFEATYRSNLTSHLRSQIETLESGHAEPSDPPEVVRDLPPVDSNTNGAATGSDGDGESPEPAEVDAPTLGGGSPTSNTPRLDALLGDQR
ncbi:MAG TPA: DivIVA domain-containing protein [Propionibacteriaceae bacterium]|nr:DivIVA domain-containing protein [Propionibacteriaceae bacterium]